MSESDANRGLSDTARLRLVSSDGRKRDAVSMWATDVQHRQREALAAHTAHLVVMDILRERRKPATVGERQPSTPQGDARQAVIDFLNQQQGDI